MAKVVYPLSVRRKALRMFADGHKGPKISKVLGISYQTFKSWTKQAKVVSKSGITEEELDAKIEAWGLDAKYDDTRAMQENEAASRRSRQNARKSHAAKFGPSPMDGKNALKSFKEFGDPEEYQKAINSWLVQVMNELNQAETIEDQTLAMIKGLLLKQLTGAIQCLPAILTTTDLVNNIKMIRTTFGMDVEKNNDRKRIDLTIINGKVRGADRKKIIDIPA